MVKCPPKSQLIDPSGGFPAASLAGFNHAFSHTRPIKMLNSAAQSIEELRKARIDREEEGKKAYTALARNAHNVLLYGTRGTGKTFLTRLIEDDIRKGEPRAFCCMVNLASLSAYGPNADEADAFPRAVLLQLCTALWTRLLGKSYLELKDHLADSGHELSSAPREELTVQAIYAHLMNRDVLHRASRTNTAGISLVAKGEFQEQMLHESKQTSVLPFEFAEFISQLLTDVLQPRNKERIIVFCDEANHAKFYEQEQILERYFELFSSRRVQFLFVAAQGPWKEKEYVPACFETTIELCGFKERSHTRSLIENAAKQWTTTAIDFSEEAMDVLIDAFSGHPRNSLDASQNAVDSALGSGLQTVTVREMLRACRDLERRLQAYEASVRSSANG